MKIWCDGGCRPNPGSIETAVVARGQVWHRADLGPGDNNDAEWLALLDAMVVARSLRLVDVVLLGDSAMVLNQTGSAARQVAPQFREYLARFGALAPSFERVRVRRVARSQNLAGIALDSLRR